MQELCKIRERNSHSCIEIYYFFTQDRHAKHSFRTPLNFKLRKMPYYLTLRTAALLYQSDFLPERQVTLVLHQELEVCFAWAGLRHHP